MNHTDGIRRYSQEEIKMRCEPLEVTPELLIKGLAVWGAPIPSAAATRLMPGIRELFELPWNALPPTVRVTQISISTETNPFPSPWTPPEVSWARVSILGLGWQPDVPVTTKWNNAYGFPDNGEGANSIKLHTPIPDQNGRFAFQTLHRGVPRPWSEWPWTANEQLVIVAYQGPLRMADQRYIPHTSFGSGSPTSRLCHPDHPRCIRKAANERIALRRRRRDQPAAAGGDESVKGVERYALTDTAQRSSSAREHMHLAPGPFSQHELIRLARLDQQRS